MRTSLALAAVLALATPGFAKGLLIPEDKALPPLAMLSHHVRVGLADQLTTTRVEQTFRNHTDRILEATYVFPVPKGAAVNKFTMWVDGKETKGELLPAKQARDVYQSIVRRTQDPGLLEYVGNDLLQLKVFPIPPKADQKVAVEFTSVAAKEGNLVEYVYPLKNDGKATSTLEGFSVKATLSSQHGVGNVYSPTHAVAVRRKNDKEVEVEFEKNQAVLDKDFQLFYSLTDSDVGLTTLSHRPVGTEAGYVSLLVTPKMDRSKIADLGQDVVLVMDTSGSMRGVKMDQARKALKYCLGQLGAKDRFAVVQFATTINRYRDTLVAAEADQVKAAVRWVEDLDASGGTAINDALKAALALRPAMTEDARPFTVVFFTDGQPTIGETNADKIAKTILDDNTRNTRIFTFGVGDDVNAVMLDRLAEGTKAIPSYVRPAEDIEAKVSGMYAKMTNPVLTDLTLTTTGEVRLTEVYPASLPDLFWGGQVVVFARYTGSGPTAVKLEGRVGAERKEFVYEVTLADKTDDRKDFVEGLWARRKVGYLLDQIRANGEKKELVDEVTALAKRYGITTPYTSWLIVPDGVNPAVTARPGQGGPGTPTSTPGVLTGPAGAKDSVRLEDFAKGKAKGSGAGGIGGPGGIPFGAPGDIASAREKLAEAEIKAATEGAKGDDRRRLMDALDKKVALDEVMKTIRTGEQKDREAGKAAVNLAVTMRNLAEATRVQPTAVRKVAGRTCVEVGGIWIDDGFESKLETVSVKAMSDAYFRLLEKQPAVKDVLQLGNFVVWVTPSGKALIIDANHGAETLKDEEIDALFAPKK